MPDDAFVEDLRRELAAQAASDQSGADAAAKAAAPPPTGPGWKTSLANAVGIPGNYDNSTLDPALKAKALNAIGIPTAAPPPAAPPAPPTAPLPPAGPPNIVFAQPPSGGGNGIPMGGGGGRPPADPFAPYYAAQQGVANAMQGEAQAQQQVGTDAGIAAGLRGQAIGEMRDDAMRAARDRDAQAAKMQKDIDEAAEEAATSKIDPERYWNNRSGFEKVMMIVGAGLSGFAQGWFHGAIPNVALEAIRAHINDDIMAQKAEIEQKRGHVQDMRGSLAEMYKRFGNLETAEAADRAAKLGQLDAQTQEFAARSGNDVIQARADVISAQLKAEVEKEKAVMRAKMMGAGGVNMGKIADRATELMKIDAANGVTKSPQDYWNLAYSIETGKIPNGMQGLGPKGGANGDGLGNINAPPPAPLSLGERAQAWAGEHGIPGFKNTEGYRKELAQNAQNLPVYSAIHKGGVRNVEHQKELGAPLAYVSSDDAETRRFKAELRREMAKRGLGAGPAADEEIPGFRRVTDEDEENASEK